MRFRTLAALSAAVVLAAAPAWASLIINPTFALSITADPNAVAIENTINNAIAIYKTDFADPITVNITFEEMSAGLGQSNKTIYNIGYSTFRAALLADSKTADDATALANSVPGGANNPVTGTSTISLSTANIKALGIAGSFPSVLSCGATCDGDISLNTSITFPGSSGSSSQYSLIAVAEHEIDEVLGLGSALPSPFQNSPAPEDLFRYTSTAGIRSFTANTGARAFFSINGSTDIAEFNNQNASADFGDWRSNPLPAGAQPEVQDAFATPGLTPALGVELRALDVIGYDLVVPEPATGPLLAAALALLALHSRRHSKSEIRNPKSLS